VHEKTLQRVQELKNPSRIRKEKLRRNNVFIRAARTQVEELAEKKESKGRGL
jgi:hypothetical protein